MPEAFTVLSYITRRVNRQLALVYVHELIAYAHLLTNYALQVYQRQWNNDFKMSTCVQTEYRSFVLIMSVLNEQRTFWVYLLIRSFSYFIYSRQIM